ncbi:MAG: hypothetical protein P0Y59_04475 [Candidatus Sphingomonas phytovorans]|nr:hypothetical protein [Sphingomonas sp.]WEK00956.1 MAG: hypothetical protein P0Y59_04475 [Sphingomonas sp.]
MPLLLMAVVAVQLSSGVMRGLPIVVVDEDGTAVSRELTRRLDAAPGLRVARARPADMRAAERIGAIATALMPWC